MPVHFIAAEGFDACRPHGGQTQHAFYALCARPSSIASVPQLLVPAARLGSPWVCAKLRAAAPAITLSTEILRRPERGFEPYAPRRAGDFPPRARSNAFDGYEHVA